ncbi:MAG: PhoH family protein [Candidatus Krumholzibacteriia bacterium]
MSADRNRDRRTHEIDLAGVDQLALLGAGDANLRWLDDRFSGTLVVRGDHLVIAGPRDEADAMRDVLEDAVERARRGRAVDAVTLDYLWSQRTGEREVAPWPEDDEPLVFFSGTRRSIQVKTPGQQIYVEAVRDHDVVFVTGPAGTGKTFLAVVMAMDYLKRNLVDRIILVRPAVEAGEQLGFLPGDLQEKINPYLRPLYDALSDIVGPARIGRYMQAGVIEASPLAFMRGRTLNNAFVILDEAQNTTVGQMKMFLTRLGQQSKAVVTGDITQIDLKDRTASGLVHVRQILRGTEGIAFVQLENRDVLRHPLVKRIVEAFDLVEARGEVFGSGSAGARSETPAAGSGATGDDGAAPGRRED